MANSFDLQNNPRYMTNIKLQKSNIFYVPLKYQTNDLGAGVQEHDTLTINIDEPLDGDENIPIYKLQKQHYWFDMNNAISSYNRPSGTRLW